MAADAAMSAPLDCSGAEPEPVGLDVLSPDGVTTTTAVLVASGDPGIVCTVVEGEEGVLSSVVAVVVETEMLMVLLLLPLEEEPDDDDDDADVTSVGVVTNAVGMDDGDDDDGGEEVKGVGVVVPLLKTMLVSKTAVAPAAAPAA
ncbi:hypothetical protein PG984_005845 [Apiospora sp. TS-2023a]